MRYKIYFGDHPLYLTDTLDADMQEIMHHDDGVYMDELSNAGIKSMIHEMRLPQRHAGVFFHEDLEALHRAFWKQFLVITAAGGMVYNDQSALLMIFRRGKWDLPKGKLDPGESIEDCALREVEEETGVRNTVLGDKLTTTYHVYDEYGKHILKESHWYRMHSPGIQPLIAQESEQITDIEWTNAERRKLILADCYPLIRDLVSAFAS